MRSHHLNGKGYFLDFLRDTGDTIGGIIVGFQIATKVPSVGSLIIGIALIVLSLILERWDRNAAWHDCEYKLPEAGEEVLGYHKDWIDPDFNPKGVRVCVIMNDELTASEAEWATAKWCSCQDTYCGTLDEDIKPSHWRKLICNA